MRGSGSMLVAMGLAACVATPGDEPEVAVHEAAAFSYYPMGFARVSAAGAAATVFNSSGGPVTVTPGVPGVYSVRFSGLASGAWPLGDAAGGHVQITAEGQGSARCRIISWNTPFGSGDVVASVRCNTPGGALAGTAFSILYFRYAFPAANPWPTTGAYSWVQSNGAVSAIYDYNSSGVHNTVSHPAPGKYTVNIPNAIWVNASMMVSAYSGATDPGAVCSIESWGAGVAYVACHDGAGNLADSAFTFSYSTTGPTHYQQGAHAWFDGSGAHPSYSRGLGMFDCSAAGVSGSLSSPSVRIDVTGELGSHDASPFLRASFASFYGGGGGYCKVESLTTSGAPPSTTATTVLRCYTPGGAVISNPRLTFTHATSDAAGPC